MEMVSRIFPIFPISLNSYILVFNSKTERNGQMPKLNESLSSFSRLMAMPTAAQQTALRFCGNIPTNGSSSIETRFVRIRIFLRDQYENYEHFNHNFNGNNRNHFE